MDVPFHALVSELRARQVRFVLIGVAGANYFVTKGTPLYSTRDRDLFLPPDPENLLLAWTGCESLRLELSANGEPLDRPRDLWLAERVVANRALTRATDGEDLLVDLTFVMAGFEFESVWRDRHEFTVEGQVLPVARLGDIVRSKFNAGRPKDRLFLETHRADLRDLLPGESTGDRDRT